MWNLNSQELQVLATTSFKRTIFATKAQSKKKVFMCHCAFVVNSVFVDFDKGE